MSGADDFNGSRTVKTARDNEFRVGLVSGESGTSATRILSVLGAGDAITAGVNDRGLAMMLKDGSGNAALAVVGAAGGMKVELVDADGHEIAITADGKVSAVVEATDLDIRNLVFANDKVDVSGSAVSVSGTVDVGNTVNVQATDLDIRGLTFGTDSVDVSGSSVGIAGSVTVEATDLDIRALDAATDNVAIKDGANALAIAADGSIKVQIVEQAGTTNVCEHAASSGTVASEGTSEHDYVVPNGKTFTGESVLVGARGQAMVEVGIWDGAAFAVKYTWFQEPKDNPTQPIAKLSLLGDGTKAIRVRITNRDGSASAVYSNISGEIV